MGGTIARHNEPSSPDAAIVPTSAASSGGRPGWVKLACWLAAGIVFLGITAAIHPPRSPASEPIGPFIDRLEGLLPHRGAEWGVEMGTHSGGLRSLGSLEGLETTVWFYAGLEGPVAMVDGPLDLPSAMLTLDELYRLAPEIRLDSGVALLGEVAVPIDSSPIDW